ncbi:MULTISPECIES: NADPH-dependent F420 reductase [unclassified Streptomyces]|uniref:NADPH-dependent F420 reductase n=1 Tax=unclassified Streptomyces TaxID=2593676 RepID=UPI002033F93A|nr:MULTISPECIES: NAD(P)-binding domain-containing protein [unclassified Streptomyces]MCM2417609.1 NAD(P)-binding domain-containing protein [Streptomyces sp. RKAG293]MCM2430167.1 NAD(P)-binding domain-containing protein [Streptomyces sp. RKAG337]
MRYAVLGTGEVGRTLAGKLVALGHEVTLGSRTKDNPAALAWAQEAGPGGHHGTFADAAAFGEVVVNATGGMVSLQALEAAGAANLAGKLLVDVANPLAFAAGEMVLDPVGSDSLGERIQRAFPQARVVKTLNTVNSAVMVDPSRVPGEHVLFLSGEDTAAKEQTAALLAEFGWPRERVVDLGGITSARGTEAYLLLWVKAMGALGHADFNVTLQRAG